MKKILMAFAEPFEFGGQETFAINIYKFINHEEYSIDFFTPYNLSNKKVEELLNKNNNKIFYYNKKFDSKFRKIYFKNCLKKFLKEHKDYDIVHLNSGSTYVLAEGARICKKNGIKKVIIHSHATGYLSLRHKITNLMLLHKFKYVDEYIACSDLAAEYRFPRKVVNEKKYIILKNGIDINKFKYDINIRNKYRKSFNIKEKEYVVGNVGRLSPEKNHKFLIDIFEKLLKKNKNYRLIIVGSGMLEEEIKNYIKEKKLTEKVILIKNRNDVNAILQAIDIFVFPSLYEGFGIAGIEAQASGLPTVCSENIPEEAKITPLFKKVKLSESIDVWVSEIEKMQKYDRKNFSEYIKDKGFDIRNTATELEKIYAKRGSYGR